ncbi:MAG: isopenicillin N synthase family oxygenase [Deltaproteobacteria bacterium]|nr:MAG: isopenicillin N synthase family oxygenase [Deltaproteobacteria bacterium]
MIQSTIPVVSLRDFGASPEAHEHFVKTLGEGLETFGFVAVTDHGIPVELLHRAYDLARQTFALPEPTKQRYETPQNGRQRGYTSMGVEHAKDSDKPDLKEFWHVGRSLGPDHPMHLSGAVPPNLFPNEVPDFAPTFSELFLAMEHFANRLLEGVGEFLELPPGTFADLVRDGNSVLRLIHYPDTGRAPIPGAVRAAQHEDINLLTVLPASTRPGLQLLTREGEWMAVETPPDVMVCDTGDMMALLTQGRLPATTHRVVNPEGSDGGRLSMPFFLHPHPDALLTPFGSDTPGVTARAFLHERLVAIGVA